MIATLDAVDRWLTPAQAARQAGVVPQRIRQLVDSGQIRSHRTPLGRLIDPDSLAEYLAERSRPAPSDDPQAA